jgi:glycosyltransferase involved in cell wall biosynthesis
MAKRRQVRVLTTGTAGAPAFEVYQGVEIFRCRAPQLDKNRFAQRVLLAGWTTGVLMATLLRKVQRGDVVLVVTNPPTLPILSIPLLALKGAKTVLRVDDLYPDALAAAKVTDKNSLVYRLLLGANRIPYRFSDTIVTIGRDMQDVIGSRLPAAKKDKIVIIPNWADLDEVEPRAKQENELLRELGIADKFVVLIAGNIGRVQGIATIVEAATKLRDNPEICFLFVGSGALESFLREEIGRRGLENVRMVPNQPRRQQTRFLNACDVALLSLTENMYGIGVPSRLYNYMAAAKPVIAVVPPRSEAALVVDEEAIGWVAPAGDAVTLAEKILEASRSPEVPAMGRKARETAVRSYSTTAITERYSELFDSL